MLSPEASEMIANIGTLTLDQARGFLPVAKSKTQEYVDLIAKFRTSSRQSEEKVRSTIAMYLHQDFDIFKPLEFSTQNPIFELHLANMEGITCANLVAELSTFDLAQTLRIIPMLQAYITTVVLDLVDVRKSIRDHEENGQLCVEYYQRASHKKRQKLESGIRKWLANNERVLLEFKQRQTVLETELMSSPATVEMLTKHLEGLLDKEFSYVQADDTPQSVQAIYKKSTLYQSLSLVLSPNFNMIPKRIASEMMGSSGKAEGGPLKRMKEMLKENADKVTFSNRETSEFKCLVLVHQKDIEFHRSNIKRWNKCIQDSEKLIQELEKTNKEYKEDIEKNRQEIVELKQEEEVILAIQKQGEVREENLRRVVQKDMTKFLEGKLEKAGLSLEKEGEADQGEKIVSRFEAEDVKRRRSSTPTPKLSSMSTIKISLKRTALEMVCKTELDDPFLKVRQALTECQRCMGNKTERFTLLESHAMAVKSEIERDEEEIRQIEGKLVRKQRNLRCVEQRLEEFRAEISELKEKEKLVLAAQDRGEEFLKTLLKSGKEELDAMIEKGLDEAENSSKKKVKVENQETGGNA
ncbi:hypothetical protein BTUL_0097g00080 [Botrytis tulipae]|uniref:Uncharacterized protein n=1 Tax=Botrytis tulipae TaxID=87230 RepID=A0A4Z1EI12_9HELO|nr:hypothetical protein BTUL_0097g00080 [Botrytis tulipae]